MARRDNYHKGDLGSRLLEVTAEILETEGIENLTMRSLSKRIGVSRTASYRHYSDKTALLKAVAEDTFKKLRTYIKERSVSVEAPLDRFKMISYSYVEFAMKNSARYRHMFSREVVSEPNVPELGEAAWSAFSEIMSVIETCQEEGVFIQHDLVEMTNVVWATVHGLSMLLIDKQIRTSENGERLHALLADDSSKPSVNVLQMVEATLVYLVEGFRGKGTA
jgi:AcrR family transcriptional regulator